MNPVGKLEWFGGDEAALDMYRMLVELAHTWDDLVDNDKPVAQQRINDAFLTALCFLPANPFYRRIQDAVLPMWLTVVSAYETANVYEQRKDERGLELAHMLRYSAGHIVAYAIQMCVGVDKAREIMPEVWKAMVPERFEHYRAEVMR